MRIFCLLLTFLVSGCAMPHFPDQNDVATVELTFNPEVFSRGGKAVIVIQEQNNIPSGIKLKGKLIFSDFDGNDITLNIDGTSVFMLDPGIYTLKNFTLYGQFAYWSTRIDYSDRYRAHFNIAAGDVVYLGKLDTKTMFSGTKIHDTEQNKTTQEVITVTTLSDQMNELPLPFLSAIQKQTGLSLSPRLLSWHDTFAKEVEHE